MKAKCFLIVVFLAVSGPAFSQVQPSVGFDLFAGGIEDVGLEVGANVLFGFQVDHFRLNALAGIGGIPLSDDEWQITAQFGGTFDISF